MKSEEMSRAVEKLMSNGADQELRIELLEQAMHNGILVCDWICEKGVIIDI